MGVSYMEGWGLKWGVALSFRETWVSLSHGVERDLYLHI